MPDHELVAILKHGASFWNEWRSSHMGFKLDLSGAFVDDASFRDINLEGVDFVGVDLEGVDLFLANLKGADLSNAHLRGANLKDACLSAATLRDADLSETDLSHAELTDADFAGANLRSASLSGAKMRNAHFSMATLENADLQSADLRGANLAQCVLRRANLRDCRIDESTVIDAKWRFIRDLCSQKAESRDLTSCDLGEANLRELNLKNAKLIGTNLSGADLTHADLADADLSGANLHGVTLTGAYLKGVRTDASTVLDERWKIVIEILTHGAEAKDLTGIVLQGANLTGARLRGAVLHGANLRDAMLRGADFRDADLRQADLTNACLSSARAWGSHDGFWLFKRIPGPDVDVADLTNAVAPAAVFRTADLTGVKLSGADLRDAIFGSELMDIPPHWQWMKFAYAHLHRYGVAQLRSANLRGANLSRAKLVCTMLENADLSDATLRDADLRRSYLAASLLHRTKLDGADLREASFATAYGHAAEVDGASFRGTRLTEENEGQPHGGYLELAACSGLETAVFDSEDFLDEYLSRAWLYLHKGAPMETEWYPRFVETATYRIRSLRRLFADDQSAPEVIRIASVINAELIAYLKRHKTALHMISPRVFEELIAELLAAFGWEVVLTAATRDGGYDIFGIATDVSGVKTSWIVECKRFAPERAVSVGIARALYATKVRLGVAGAMLATTSRFTEDAKQYAAATYDLALKDYDAILEWINVYRPNPDGRLYIKNNMLVVPGRDY